MDKFSDGFSNKSYDDLLNEYAGESLVGKSNRHQEEKAPSSERAKQAPVKRDFGENTVRQRTEKKPHAPVIETPRKPRQANPVPSRPATQKTAAPRVSQTNSKQQNLDLHEIKSFEEEMAAKKPVRTNYANTLNDTMEFRKGANKSEPVIQKINTTGRKKASSISKLLPKRVQNTISKMPKKSKSDILTALKVNRTIFIGFAVCLLVSIIVSIGLLSCVNDVLAIGRDAETPVEVNLPNNANTRVAVDVLKDAGLIKNKLFCTVFIKAMGYKDNNYLPGVYYFTESMGVEKMIKRFKTSSTRGALISITIPEGFTIDKIFERLEKNNICTSAALFKTIDEVDFSSEYDFIAPIPDKEQRYHVLEGYFFPATYEFQQGADPATVVRTFLDAFKKHWTDEYAKRAEELGMTTDEIIILASVIEKEGANTKQFTQISSVLHNRLNRSGLYPLLECNSTKDYVTNTIANRVSSKPELNNYIMNYNTYEKEGLPVSAICNPGEAAVEAALYPDNTQYYFFAHDNNMKIYMAETMDQHDRNLRTIAQINAQSKK